MKTITKTSTLLSTLAVLAATIGFAGSAQASNDTAGINLASTGVASQSSTYGDGIASRAIDGNTAGMWGGNSVTHTNGANSWWQVKLLRKALGLRVPTVNRGQADSPG